MKNYRVTNILFSLDIQQKTEKKTTLAMVAKMGQPSKIQSYSQLILYVLVFFFFNFPLLFLSNNF